jgi:hypothetical protein
LTRPPDGSTTPDFEQQLGRQLAALVAREGAQAFTAGVANRRIQAGVQDLAGADTTLATPLRDLVQRPGFRLLFSNDGMSQTIGARDALLAEMGQVYSPAVLQRLNRVLDGCLGPATWATTPPFTQQPSPAQQPSHAVWLPEPTHQAPPQQPAPPQVITVQSSNGLVGGLMALVGLMAGALLLGLVWFVQHQRTLTTASPTPTPPASPGFPTEGAGTQPRNDVSPAAPEPDSAPDNPTPPADTWAACLEDDPAGAAPPQRGEVWWPVVGPKESLQDARAHCRPDAYLNQSGNVQVASFRDRETAAAFAEQLTRDNSHPHHFWVGDASVR